MLMIGSRVTGRGLGGGKSRPMFGRWQEQAGAWVVAEAGRDLGRPQPPSNTRSSNTRKPLMLPVDGAGRLRAVSSAVHAAHRQLPAH